MKFTTSTKFTHQTIEELREQLKVVEHILKYWTNELENRAFGEIEDGNLSYEEWREIYIRNGWVEVPEYECFRMPSALTNVLKDVTIDTDWANYKKDKSVLDIWKCWNKYHQQWNYRINRLEMESFNIRRVEQIPKITMDEALFILLGLSPSVFGTVGFKPLSLYENTFEIADIHYQDVDGNDCIANSNLYADESSHSPHLGKLGHMEWFLQEKEEYQLIDRNEQFKCVSGRIFSGKFLKWAYKHNYLVDRQIHMRDKKKSPYGEEFAKELFDELTEVGFIRGGFDNKWELHKGNFHALHYLANELKGLGLVETKQKFKDIEQYILYESTHPLKQQFHEGRAGYETDDGKLYTDKHQLVDKALRKIAKRQLKEK